MNQQGEALLARLNARSQGNLPQTLGVEMTTVAPGRLTSRMPITPMHLAANGYTHAASIVALADTTCGYGTVANLPPGAENFTTIEIKCNFPKAFRPSIRARALRRRTSRRSRSSATIWAPCGRPVRCAARLK